MRDIRRWLASWLRRDKAGVQVPHGSPLDASPYERLLAAGENEPATGDIDDLPPPLRWTGPELPSKVLERLRNSG